MRDISLHSNKLKEVKTQIKYNDEIVDLHFNTKKIRNYEPKEIISLLQKISGIGFLIGLSEPMIDIESQAIIDFWCVEFSDVSFSEVEKAIKLNSSMKLEKKIEHYNKFSTDFLGSVLYHYKAYRAKRLAKYTNTVNPCLELTDTTEKDKIALLLKADTDTFKELNTKFINGKSKGFELMHGVRYFDCLKRMGKIPDYKDSVKWKELSNEEYKEADGKDKEGGLIVKGSIAYNKVIKRYKSHLLERYLSELLCVGVEDLIYS